MASNERQRRDRPDAWMGHQENGIVVAFGLFQNRAVQLLAQHRPQAHELVAMPEQLPPVAFGWRGNPDFRKTLGEQQIENEPGVALIGLLFAYFTGANPGEISMNTPP